MSDFRGLPRETLGYTVAGVLVTTTLVAVVGHDLTWSRSAFFFLLLAFITAQIPYRLPGLRAKFYLSFGIDLATLLAVGPAVAIFNAFAGRLAGILVAEGTRRHVPLQGAIIRASEGVLAFLPTLLVFDRLAPLEGTPYLWWLPYIGATLSYAFVGTSLEALGGVLRYGASFRALVFRDLAANSSNALLQVMAGALVGGFFRTRPMPISALWVDVVFAGLVVYSARLYAGMAELHWSTMHAIINAMDLRDPHRAGHSERVARLAVAVGRKLNLPEHRLNRLYEAGLLHDVGLVALDEELLLKSLPPRARQRMTADHLEQSAAAVTQMELEPGMEDFVRYHHQWFNGNGVPGDRRGEEIPLEARILALVNAYDSLLTPRAYRPPISRPEARRRLKNGAYTEYDPALVEVLEALLLEEERWGTPVFIRRYWLDSLGTAPRW